MINKYNIIQILTIIIIIIIIILSKKKNNIERIENLNKYDNSLFENIEIVIARYNENIEWINKPPFNKFKSIICYNKGKSLNHNDYNNNIKFYKLDNVGKCDHTYIYHIIANYYNLKNITIFLPGSWTDMIDYDKYNYTLTVINKTIETQNTVFFGQKINNLYLDLYNFEINKHVTTNPSNRKLFEESELLLSDIRPYGKWYEKIFNTNNIIKIVTFLGIFSVHKNHILQHPIEYYQNIINYINNHPSPEVGHYIERSWGSIFYPYPSSCLHYYYDF